VMIRLRRVAHLAVRIPAAVAAARARLNAITAQATQVSVVAFSGPGCRRECWPRLGGDLAGGGGGVSSRILAPPWLGSSRRVLRWGGREWRGREWSCSRRSGGMPAVRGCRSGSLRPGIRFTGGRCVRRWRMRSRLRGRSIRLGRSRRSGRGPR
jgi:hypothetical protein